jgi:hypothetical protein
MISKHVLQIFALLAIFAIVFVPYSSAAGEEVVQRNIDMEIDSANQDRYDEVVNLGDPQSAVTNPQTWNPSPQGIWLGASTEESLFRFSEILHSSNQLDLFHEVEFNSTQIMNGASVTIIRSPIHSEGVITQTLYIYRMISDEWGIRLAWGGAGHSIDAEDYVVVADININMADSSITTGDDCWTLSNRTYVELHAPIYSGVSYVLHWTATYEADARPAIYLSSQDVANDENMLTCVGLYNLVEPDNPSINEYNWDVELGVSYDMINGLGNGLYAESIYVHAGDYLTWETSAPDRPENRDYYHTLMLPFVTDDHTLNASVRYTYASAAETLVWEESRTNWYDYIMACSDTALGLIEFGRHMRVNITFNEDVRINLMFMDSPDVDYLDNQAHFSLQGTEHIIYARPWASYQLSLGEVQPPSVNPYDWPGLMDVQENQQQTWFGTIIGVVMIVVGGAVMLTGLGIPLGAALIAGGVTMVILEDIAHKSGYKGLPDLVAGVFTNVIDAIWDGLCAIGEFLWSIGEGIWDAITWFVDAVIEYGAVLLGLLIIAVALGIFFMAIFVQLKLWGITWRMAEGDLQKAAAQAQGLASQGQSVVGKLRGRI